jgi:hypothetical protein
MSDMSFSREPIRAAQPPAPTAQAQEKAHDPALVSPEPPAEFLQQGRLS